jgi:hypothetical protein
VAFQPSTFRITRSATIAASPAAVFAEANDLHRFQNWSPWAKLDPNAKLNYEGPAAGMGAAFSWAGNSDIGEGKMTIIDSQPGQLVRCKLEFYKPMAGVAASEFTFKPEGQGTVVTWSMSGQNNFLARAVCMFMNMDKMIGGQFEQGLASLKTIAEGTAKK